MRYIYPYPSGLLHWHLGKTSISPKPVWKSLKSPVRIDWCQSTKSVTICKLCLYFLVCILLLLFYHVLPWSSHVIRAIHMSICMCVWDVFDSVYRWLSAKQQQSQGVSNICICSLIIRKSFIEESMQNSIYWFYFSCTNVYLNKNESL